MSSLLGYFAMCSIIYSQFTANIGKKRFLRVVYIFFVCFLYIFLKKMVECWEKLCNFDKLTILN